MGPAFHGIHYQGSITEDGTIYFPIDLGGDRRDIFRSRLVNGLYQPRESLGQTVNSFYDDSGPFIAPDESYLIFSSNRPGGYGTKDLYVCYRRGDGSWTPPLNMGYLVNGGQFESWASVSPDGKYLFVIKSRDGGNTFWMDARVIGFLKRRIVSAPEP